MGETPVQRSKVQPCHGQETTPFSSRYPSPSGPPWCGQVLSSAWIRPPKLKIATTCSFTFTTLLPPGGISSARPQRAWIGIGSPSANQVLPDVGGPVRAAGGLTDAVRHEGQRPAHPGRLLRIGQRLEPHGEAVTPGRELDEKLLRVSPIDDERIEQGGPPVALAVKALDLDQELPLADDERLEAPLAVVDRDPPFQDDVRHAAPRAALRTARPGRSPGPPPGVPCPSRGGTPCGSSPLCR